MTGMDLRLLRVSKRIPLTTLAKAMGISHPRLSQIEAQLTVTDAMVGRYIKALDALTRQPA